MEQRALLAVGLVAGCVTAAGAGGYLAVRQIGRPAEPAKEVLLSEPDVAVSRSATGTEAELAPVIETGADAPRAPQPQEARALPETAVEPAPPAPTRPRATPPRADGAAVPAPAGPPSSSQTGSRPVRTPSAAEAPVATTEPIGRAPAAAGPVARDGGPAPSRPTSSGDRDSASDRAATTADDRWPEREPRSANEPDILPSRTADIEPTAPPEPVKRLETATIPADSVIGVQIETTTSSETARVEDTVRARVTRDVVSQGVVVVPAGSRLIGNVTLVEDGGRIRERARLGVRFHTLVLADGSEVRLPTETIYRDGESPAKQSAAKIGGGAASGAILGAILGGTRGAIIGAATGAGGGTAAAMAGGRKPAEIRAGQAVTVRVSSDVETHVER